MTYRSLQAARAVAAIMVVLFHVGAMVEKYFSLTAFNAPWGRAGVEFFFVLSGFIITTAHWNDIGKPGRIGRFAWKRFVRIYPTYWVVFLITLAGAYKLLGLSGAEIAKAMLLLPTGTAPVISVAWSLQWELMFYILFGALILSPILAVGLLAAALLWFQGSWTLFTLFLAGAACAVIDLQKVNLSGRALAAFGAVVFGVSGAIETITERPPTLWYGLGAALLVLGLVRSEKAGQTIGANAILQRLGDASYSIYLIHYPLISAMCKIARKLGTLSASWGVVWYCAMLFAALGGGWVFHVIVERPMTRWLGGRKSLKPFEPSEDARII